MTHVYYILRHDMKKPMENMTKKGSVEG